ncbi:uncharacterized protein LOC105163000 isoform X2 [Sesamum indicum]|uniref:Uncharacterized protein LOC105163000 isoform X2 n=1 Tax=Sesamum indicum TaxID=4182 RepID=A0A6I9TAU1_SESIN|nr:uncharacterized protein LOC105163000 isoform X2 [Sesamum indicum]
MDNSDAKEILGLKYWLQWQVLVCALILLLTTALAILLLRKRGSRERASLKPPDLWTPCWRNLHPRWLLFYRAFAFIAMAYLLYQTVAAFGFFVFFFYTQWTFALVMVYFALATIVSIQGCRIYARKPLAQTGERDKFIKKDSEDIDSGKPSVSKQRKSKGVIKLEFHHNPTPTEQLGFLENLLQIIYQTCAGAAMLTDIVFWCLLLPFMTGEDFQLTLPFTWFGLVYFVLWSCAYVVFQWVLHACCFTWWPYPFFDLSTPWAPLWYLALGLVHIPCYGLYVLLKKAKNAAFSTMFPQKFVRASSEKKQV